MLCDQRSSHARRWASLSTADHARPPTGAGVAHPARLCRLRCGAASEGRVVRVPYTLREKTASYARRRRVRCDEGLGGLPYVDAYRLTLTLQFQRARFHEAQIESGGLICGFADERFAGPGL